MTPKRPSGSPAVRNPPSSKAERDERIHAALRDVDTNQIPVKQAAKNHDVAYTTLLARRKGRRSRLEYQNDVTKLRAGTERSIVQWCKRQARLFVPVTPKLVRERAIHVLRGITGDPEADLDVHWPQALLSRHPDLKSTMSRQVTAAKVRSCTRETINEWFDHLGEYLSEVGVTTDLIYNMDETGFNLGDVRRHRVYTDSRSNPRGQTLSNDSQAHVTVIECVSRTRHDAVPPFFVFRGKGNTRSALDCQVPVSKFHGTMAAAQIGFSESAFVSERHCLTWLIECFDKYTREALGVSADSADPPWRCLLMDNLSAHITHAMLAAAETRNIMVVALPPNTTHILQPLDVGVFSHLKQEWHNHLKSRLVDTGGTSIKMDNALFIETYAKVRQAAIDSRVCRNAFERCGIGHQLDRTVILAQLPVERTPSPPVTDSIMPGTPVTMADFDAYLDLVINHSETLNQRQRAIARRQMHKGYDFWYTEGLSGREQRRRTLEAEAAAREQRQTTRRRLHVPEGPLSIENLQAARQSQLSSHHRINMRRSDRSRKPRGNGTAAPAANVENQPLSMPLDGEVNHSARSPSIDPFQGLPGAEDDLLEPAMLHSAI